MPLKLRRDLTEGDRVGPYIVDARLGEGGMAEVFAGHHAQTGARVALKRSLLDPETLHIRLPMFQREARIAVKLLHPNIVTTYELVVDPDGNPVLVMELLDGVPVKEAGALLRKTNGGFRLAVELVHAAARALDYLHAQQDPDSPNKDGRGLIHRDVAPDNLFLTFSGSVKLLDFGLAKEADDGRLTRTGMLKGKAAYMSPEQIEGAPLDERTDQYALGITTYWLLTGVLPFERDNVPKTLNAVLADPLTPPSSINRALPKKVDAVLARVTARDRARRFPSCSAFAMALDEALARTEAPLADVTLAAIAREASEGQKPTIVLGAGGGARGAVIGADASDPGLDMPTDPQGRAPSRSDDERTVVEPAPLRPSTSPDDRTPAGRSDDNSGRVAGRGKRKGKGKKKRGSLGGSDPGLVLDPHAAGPVPDDAALDPVFSMPHSLPSGLHPAPAPSSLGPVLAGVSLAVVIAGVGVLWLLLPDILGGLRTTADAGPRAALDAGAASGVDAGAAAAPLPAGATAADAGVVNGGGAQGAAIDAGAPIASDAGAATPTAPTVRELRVKAAPHIEWRGPDDRVVEGSGALTLAPGVGTVSAHDRELDVTTLVPVPADATALDYALLPRTEVQILVRPWAEVTIGNKNFGLTPLKPLKLVAGRYRLKLKHDSGEQTHEIDVGGSERIDLRYRF